MNKKQTFTFKKFVINQSKTAMKVCTDACIFGAYIGLENAKNILDIGTGTGLLSLMMAQRTHASIDAVEIDADAYHQAIENIRNSPFQGAIQVFHTSIQAFSALKKTSYDLIISNPPFYQNSLQSPDNQANKAHHGIMLSLEDLMISVRDLLKNDGKFMVLLPPFETKQLENLAQKYGFSIAEQLEIRHSAEKKILRIISTFQRLHSHPTIQKKLIIYQNDHPTYSEDFRHLLKDYYLIF
jgi:tRNA1Val (adenine37-N6)-methyltransferase